MALAAPAMRTMPSPAEMRPAPITAKEAAHARPAEKMGPKVAPKEAQAAQKTAEELRGWAAKNPDADASHVFRMKKDADPLSPTAKKGLEQIPDAQGKVPSGEVRQILAFEQYSNVQLGLQRGMTLDAACRAQGIDTAQYADLKNGVMDSLTQMRVVQEIMPGLNGMSEAQRRGYVEAYLGANPALREKVVERALAVASKSLQAGESNGSAGAAERTAQSAAQDARIAEVNKRLKLQGKNTLTSDEVAAAAAGGDPNEVRQLLYQKALEAQGVNNPGAAQDFLRLRDEVATLDNRIAAAKGSERAQLQTERGKLAGQLKAAEDALAASHDTVPAVVQADAEAQKNVYGTKDRLGNQIGGVNRLAQDMVDGQRRIQEAETKANASLSPEQTLAQEELRRETATLMEDAITDVVNEQMDELRAIQDRKMAADALQAEKKGQTALARATEQVSKEMTERGVKLEGGKKRSDKKSIGEKMRFMADHGKKEGVPRLMMRDMLTEPNSTLEVVDAAGNKVNLTMDANGGLHNPDGTPYTVELQVKQADGSYRLESAPASYENLPLSSVSGQSKEILDTLVEKQGEDYAHRLLVDFQYALRTNSSRDIGNVRDLKLTNGQQEALAQEFGVRLLQETKNEAMEIKNWKRQMREAGVGMNWGLLMTLLMLLGGGVRKMGAPGAGEATV